MQGDQFSSFQIGKMLQVSRQAVNQWIDKGFIVSYRTPGGHRRVCRADLLEFLRVREIPIPKELQSAADPAAATPVRIAMIIDDDPNTLMLIRHALTAKNPHLVIESFDHGFDALMAIGANPPDLLLLDPRMLGSDVRGVCQCLRRNRYTAHLPILIVSDEIDAEGVMLGGLGGHGASAAWKSARTDHLHHGSATEFCSRSAPALQIAERALDLLKHCGRPLAIN